VADRLCHHWFCARKVTLPLLPLFRTVVLCTCQYGTVLYSISEPTPFLPSDYSSGQDAVAVAFCEAKLLAVLRRQQWAHKNLQSREICVLVRNARSTAYRRAMATVVLEQQEADLEFL
jgi:hypothetical protein